MARIMIGPILNLEALSKKQELQARLKDAVSQAFSSGSMLFASEASIKQHLTAILAEACPGLDKGSYDIYHPGEGRQQVATGRGCDVMTIRSWGISLPAKHAVDAYLALSSTPLPYYLNNKFQVRCPPATIKPGASTRNEQQQVWQPHFATLVETGGMGPCSVPVYVEAELFGDGATTWGKFCTTTVRAGVSRILDECGMLTPAANAQFTERDLETAAFRILEFLNSPGTGLMDSRAYASNSSTTQWMDQRGVPRDMRASTSVLHLRSEAAAAALKSAGGIYIANLDVGAAKVISLETYPNDWDNQELRDKFDLQGIHLTDYLGRSRTTMSLEDINSDLEEMQSKIRDSIDDVEAGAAAYAHQRGPSAEACLRTKRSTEPFQFYGARSEPYDLLKLPRDRLVDIVFQRHANGCLRPLRAAAAESYRGNIPVYDARSLVIIATNAAAASATIVTSLNADAEPVVGSIRLRPNRFPAKIPEDGYIPYTWGLCEYGDAARGLAERGGLLQDETTQQAAIGEMLGNIFFRALTEPPAQPAARPASAAPKKKAAFSLKAALQAASTKMPPAPPPPPAPSTSTKQRRCPAPPALPMQTPKNPPAPAAPLAPPVTQGQTTLPPPAGEQERQSKRQAVEGAGHGADLMDTGRTQSPER
eukprot:XP_001690318.1 predicted protein [Chlamydomonas reinhardtii]